MNTNWMRIFTHKAVMLALVLVVVSMLITGCPPQEKPAPEGKPMGIKDIDIPSDYGKIEERWEPKTKPSDKIVVVIGERHDSVEVWENILSILEYLRKEYNISFIGIEGTPKGRLDTSSYRSLPENEDMSGLKEKIARTLVGDLEISPFEYMGIIYNDIDIYGVEDPDLYEKHRKSEIGDEYGIDYEKLVNEKNRLLNQIMNRLLEALQKRLDVERRTKERKELATKVQQFNDGKIEFSDFLEYAAKIDSVGFGELKTIWDELLTGKSAAPIKFHYYLKKKLEEYGITFPPIDMPNLAKYDKRLSDVRARGLAMVDNLISLMDKQGKRNAILRIGAAHIEVMERLREKGVAYLFVVPKGMMARATKWEEEAFKKSLKGEKPPGFAEWSPVKIAGQSRVDKPWFRAKAEFLYEGIIATSLKRTGRTNEEIASDIKNYFSKYEKKHGNSFVPNYSYMREISGDIYLPFKVAGREAILRVTQDEIAYNKKPDYPILAHGRITSRDYYQIIDNQFWQKSEDRENFIVNNIRQRAPESFRRQCDLIYNLIMEGKSVKDVEEDKRLRKLDFDAYLQGEMKADYSTISPTGTDIYVFFKDFKTGKKRFIRLTKEAFKAWQEPNSHVVRHGPVAEDLRYEEIDLEPLLRGLRQDIKEKLLTDQVSLAKLDARLRSPYPSALLLSVKLDEGEVYLAVKGAGNEVEVKEVAISKPLPSLSGLVKLLMEHLRPMWKGDKVTLLDVEEGKFVLVDLPRPTTLASEALWEVLPPLFLYNDIIWVSGASTIRDIERGLKVEIDHQRLKIIVSLPYEKRKDPAARGKWNNDLGQLRRKIKEKLRLERDIIIDVTDYPQDKAKGELLNSLVDKESLILSFEHMREVGALDVGGGEERGTVKIDDIKHIKISLSTKRGRFIALACCYGFTRGWPDVILQFSDLSLGFWGKFTEEDMMKFLGELIERLGEDISKRPQAIPLFLEIIKKLRLPAGMMVKLPSDQVVSEEG